MRNELLQAELELLERARIAASNAHAPYSNFRVGAAVITDAGLFTGCNVENASYGLSMCAERAAVFAAVQAGAKRLTMLAVSCVDAAHEMDLGFRMPCGACRQVISEFMEPQGSVIVDGAGTWTLSELLPEPFRLK